MMQIDRLREPEYGQTRVPLHNTSTDGSLSADLLTMSRFFPHTAYAEDQPLATTILTTHVYYRGFQTGAFLGLTGSAASSAFKRQPILLPNVLRATGNGAIIGTALMVPGLAFYLWGQEDIAWKDRSWRLMENKGQLETDDWSLAGTVVGGLAAATRTSAAGARATTVKISGGAGLGSLVGCAGYMAWRYGVKGGKWED